jgi:hypothetical protein
MSVEITPERLAASGTEEGHQSALFCYAQAAEKTDYRWGMLYSIPNGGKRGAATAARMKATGTKSGFPDIGVAWAMGRAWDGPAAATRNRYHGLFIELKRPTDIGKKAGKLAIAQKYWRDRLQAEGYAVHTCYGWIDAVKTIEAYFLWTLS